MYIIKNGIILRDAEVKDIKKLSSWWADGKIMEHAGFPNGLKTDELKLYKRIIDQNEKKLPSNLLIIIELENHELIGEMNYSQKSKHIFEIGIKICDFSKHNKGYGSIAVKELIKYLEDKFHAKKIVLDTNLKNVKAQNFYKRLGFKQIRILKDNWKNQLNELQSTVMFELVLSQ